MPAPSHHMPLPPTREAYAGWVRWGGRLTARKLTAAQPGVRGAMLPVSTGGGSPGAPPNANAGSESKRLMFTSGPGAGR